MKRITYCITFMLCLVLTIGAFGQAAETVNGTVTTTLPFMNLSRTTPNTGTYYPPNPIAPVLIYDNGPIINVAPDRSRVENVTLGMTFLGAGAQTTANNRVADEVTLAADYDISELDFYTYQTGSTTTSTITGITLQIWDGVPGAGGSTVVWGDATTNVLAATTWSNVYRDSETTPATNRPIMVATVAPVGLTLTAGTYWLDWNYSGSLASGPWAPPIAILGVTTTGNALQSIAGGAYNPLLDAGTSSQQGLPFQIYGTALAGGPVTECGTGNPQPIPVTGTGGFPCVGGPTTSPANVSATGTIGAAAGDYTLDSVEINLTHTWDSDLDITLVSPMGTSLDLSSDNGGSGDNYTNTVFMDGAPLITTGAAPFTGTFQAEGGTFATTFAGEPINGNWTLSICDDTGGDSGTLLSYCINFSEILVVGNPPTITCPGDITINNTGGLCSGVANFIGIADDIEDGNLNGSIIATPPSGSAFAVGDTMVTLSVTDSDGNTATCDFMVTVLDAEDPVAVCQDITVDLDASGMATITAADVDNGSTDNCAIASMSLDVSSFDCSMTGANTVTLTVTDNAGNSSTCTSTVTVQDVTAPVITCIGAPGTVTDTASDSPALAIPDSNPVGVSTTITIADDFDITDLNVNLDITHTWVGDLIVTLESPAGTSAVLIDRMGTTSGGVGCSSNDLMITLDDEATSPIEDECQPGPPAASGSFTPNNPLSAFDGESTMGDWILTISDNAGGDTGTLNTWGLEYSYDVSATPLNVYLDANGMASIDPNDLINTVDEACGYTITAGGGGGGTMGSLTTLFATNNGGSSGWAVMYDVTVGPNDIEVTEIDINTSGTVAFDLDLYVLTGTYVGNETNAAAWGAPAASGSGVGAGTDLPSNVVLGTPVMLSANTTYGFAVVTTGVGQSYTNGTGCPGNQCYSNSDITIDLGSAVAGLFSGSVFSPRVWNGTIHYTIAGSDLDFTCADLGENQIEVTVTDDSGNVDTCIATVNVIDLIAPIITCGPEPTVSETVSDSPNLAIPDNDPTGVNSTITITEDVTIDDLNINLDVTHTWVGDVTTTITSPAGTSVIIVDRPGYTGSGFGCSGDDILATLDDAGTGAVEDQCGAGVPTIDGTFTPNNPLAAFNGESTMGDWTITISDSAGGDTGTLNSWGITYSYANTNTDIVIELGPDGTAIIDPYDIINSIDEACGIDTAAVDVNEVSCADIGTTILVTVFVNDTSGNTASCSANITVVDLLPPVLTCPADQTVDPGAGNLFYILPDYFATGEATADDNCTDPVTITTQDPAPGTPLPDGTYTITMTATDEYGNTSTCDFELTVETILGVDSNNLEAGLALYPNPAGNVVNLVNRTNISLEKMMIFDINGKLVSQTDLRTMQGEKAVDVSSLASGVYMVQIIGDNASTVKRLIKE